jgi:hypothetical protein
MTVPANDDANEAAALAREDEVDNQTSGHAAVELGAICTKRGSSSKEIYSYKRIAN